MTHAGPDLVVDSVTGVDVSLTLAGPGVRAFAFMIDWVIRAALFVAWYVIAALLYNREWNLTPPPDPEGSWFGLVVLPGAGIYLLYHCVAEIIMRGRTPGKRMTGVRLVSRNGAVPPVTAHLIRNAFRLVDSFPLLYGVGLVATMVTRDHVRVGDLAAGTLLVYDRADDLLLHRFVAEANAGGRVDASTVELVNELLGRWDALDKSARARLATALLSRAKRPPETGATPNDDSLRRQLEHLARGAAP